MTTQKCYLIREKINLTKNESKLLEQIAKLIENFETKNDSIIAAGVTFNVETQSENPNELTWDGEKFSK